MEPIFFEIPIYRISNKTHDSEMESMKEKHYNLFPSERIGKAFEGYQQFIEKRYWYP